MRKKWEVAKERIMVKIHNFHFISIVHFSVDLNHTMIQNGMGQCLEWVRKKFLHNSSIELTQQHSLHPSFFLDHCKINMIVMMDKDWKQFKIILSLHLMDEAYQQGKYQSWFVVVLSFYPTQWPTIKARITTIIHPL